jgi:uroporphyrinogen decarboxylase
MTSRELVRRAVTFDGPVRVPRQTWVTPWAEARYPRELTALRQEFPDDIATAPAVYRVPPAVEGGPSAAGQYTDEWGCRFDNAFDDVLGKVREPLIASWDQLDGFQTPDALLGVDAGAVDAFCAATERFTLAGTLIRPFERLCCIRTAEQALTDLAERPGGLVELLRRIHAHYLREVEVWARTGVDAIVIMDDWGTQRGMVASPQVFRRDFLPMYRDYAAVARQHGKFVFMHADGNILDILDDVIAAGVQAINTQISCRGAAELGRRYRGRLTFWGDVDRHAILSQGTLMDVRRAVGDMRDHLYARGGVIAQCEFGPGAIPEHVAEVFRAWRALDKVPA